MKYLFFDIECANCFDGKGKICEFGYVQTDENFSIIEKESFKINPCAPFDKKGFEFNKKVSEFNKKSFGLMKKVLV